MLLEYQAAKFSCILLAIVLSSHVPTACAAGNMTGITAPVMVEHHTVKVRGWA